MCNIVEVWFGIVNGRISSFFSIVICPPDDSGGVLTFQVYIWFSFLLRKKKQSEQLDTFSTLYRKVREPMLAYT